MSKPTSTDSEALETEIRRLVERGEEESAVARFMQAHGGDILALLCLHFAAPQASAALCTLTEDVTRQLPRFKWKTTLRSWVYTLARDEILRRRSGRNGACLAERFEGSCCESAGPRTSRRWAEHRMRELCQQLDADDQTLLVLRIDKGLSWMELAAVFSGRGDKLDEASGDWWVTELRHRFAALRRHLYALAEAEGLAERKK